MGKITDNHTAIKQRFEYLYHCSKLGYEGAIKQLKKEFRLSHTATVLRLLREAYSFDNQ